MASRRRPRDDGGGARRLGNSPKLVRGKADTVQEAQQVPAHCWGIAATLRRQWGDVKGVDEGEEDGMGE